MSDLSVDEEALEFFNGLSGQLAVELTEPAHSISENLPGNLVAPTGARVKQVSLELRVFEEDDFRDLSEEEWSRVVIRAPSVRMRGESEVVVEHPAPDGNAFTVRDLGEAVAKTERQGRDESEWFGGVDVHHVFFEGISLEDDGVWSICWGS